MVYFITWATCPAMEEQTHRAAPSFTGTVDIFYNMGHMLSNGGTNSLCCTIIHRYYTVDISYNMGSCPVMEEQTHWAAP